MDYFSVMEMCFYGIYVGVKIVLFETRKSLNQLVVDGKNQGESDFANSMEIQKKDVVTEWEDEQEREADQWAPFFHKANFAIEALSHMHVSELSEISFSLFSKVYKAFYWKGCFR